MSHLHAKKDKVENPQVEHKAGAPTCASSVDEVLKQAQQSGKSKEDLKKEAESALQAINKPVGHLGSILDHAEEFVEPRPYKPVRLAVKYAKKRNPDLDEMVFQKELRDRIEEDMYDPYATALILLACEEEREGGSSEAQSSS
ncbi:MAG: hypothetical protein Q9162_007344 [Coniocarpon cinnabarinum]